MKIIAKHSNGNRIWASEKRFISIETSDLVVTREVLENGRSFCIAKSPFFENYLGVGFNWPTARIATRQAIGRFLNKLSSEETLFQYLSDKGYEFTLWGSAYTDLYKTRIIRVI